MPNQYVNRVDYGNQTIMDITDTSADAADVIEGEVFYSRSGARTIGTLGDATTTTHGLMSAIDKAKLDTIIDDTAGTGDTNKAWSADKLTSQFSAKVDKETGKGLSTNDFTTALKTKLEGLVVATVAETQAIIDEYEVVA